MRFIIRLVLALLVLFAATWATLGIGYGVYSWRGKPNSWQERQLAITVGNTLWSMPRGAPGAHLQFLGFLLNGSRAEQWRLLDRMGWQGSHDNSFHHPHGFWGMAEFDSRDIVIRVHAEVPFAPKQHCEQLLVMMGRQWGPAQFASKEMVGDSTSLHRMQVWYNYSGTHILEFSGVNPRVVSLRYTAFASSHPFYYTRSATWGVAEYHPLAREVAEAKERMDKSPSRPQVSPMGRQRVR